MDIVGDDFELGIAGRFDVAVYFDIARLPAPETAVAVLSQVESTLKPGGTLVFVDPLANRAHRSCPAALMEWLMTLARTTLGTRPSSSFSTVKGWLEQVGLGSVRSYLLIPLGATMITARKT